MPRIEQLAGGSVRDGTESERGRGWAGGRTAAGATEGEAKYKRGGSGHQCSRI